MENFCHSVNFTLYFEMCEVVSDVCQSQTEKPISKKNKEKVF